MHNSGSEAEIGLTQLNELWRFKPINNLRNAWLLFLQQAERKWKAHTGSAANLNSHSKFVKNLETENLVSRSHKAFFVERLTIEVNHRCITSDLKT